MSAALTTRLPVVDDFVARRQHSLRGFAKVTLPSGMILHDVAIHADDAGKSARAMAASKPMLDRAGAVMRDPAGKVRYSPVVTFTSKAVRDRFSASVIEALLVAFPDALS